MRTITLRSHVQLKNTLQIPFDVYLPDSSEVLLSRIEPGQVYDVPIRHLEKRKLEICTENHKRATLSWDTFMDHPDIQSFTVLTCDPVVREQGFPDYLNVDFTERSFEWNVSTRQSYHGR